MALKRFTSPEDAQRKVTRFVILEIGDRLYGGNPREARDQEGRDCWSVPVMLALPDDERRKEVGKILVDTATGRIQITNDTLSTLSTKAERLASRTTPQKTRTAAVVKGS